MNGPERDHLTFRIGSRIKVGHDPSPWDGQIGVKRCKPAFGVVRIERRDIDAGNPHGFPEQARTRPPFRPGTNDQIAKFRNKLLAFAKQHDVDERRQRFGSNGASPSNHHERPPEQIFPPVGRPQRNAGQIQHVQHIGVAEFMRNGEGKHMRSADGSIAFQRSQADAVFAQQLSRLVAWRINPFRKNIVPPIQDSIQDLVSEIGHAHLVEIRKGQCTVQPHRSRVLVHGTFFGAEIMTGPRKQRKQFFHEETVRLENARPQTPGSGGWGREQEKEETT